MKNNDTYAYKYVADFKCIGPDCSDSCCNAGWVINVDNDTVELYKKEAKELLDTVVKKDGNIYQAILDETGACICVGEDKLCKIQNKYGEDFLSDTCNIYPRNIFRLHNKKIAKASFSCPEIVRKVLFDLKDPFELVKYENRHLESHEENNGNPKTAEVMGQIHDKIVSYVKNFQDSPELLLAYFLSISLSFRFINNEDKSKATEFYLRTIAERAVIEFEVNDESVFSILFSILFETRKVGKNYKDLILAVSKELDLKIDLAKTELQYNAKSVKKFKDKLNNWNLKSKAKYEKTFLSIVKYYFISNAINFLKPADGSFLFVREVIAKYSLMKFFCVALADNEGNVDESKFVNIVESIARNIDHKVSIKTLHKNMDDLKLSNEARLLGLLQSLTDSNLSQNKPEKPRKKELERVS